MMGIEVTHFDQTAAFLTAFSALALIRERKPLPFIAAVIGAVFEGALIPSLLGALIVWHRIDRECRKWVQFRDFAGLFFILAGSIAQDPLRPFFSFFGVFLLSVSFGGAALGTLPAFLFLRQYHPQPELLEVVLVSHAAYWILVEISRWTEIKHEKAVLGSVEVIASGLILIPFRAEIEKWISDPVMAAAGGLIMLFLGGVALWAFLRPAGPTLVFQRLRPALTEGLVWGGRWISGDEPWTRPEPEASSSFDEVAPRILWWLAAIAAFCIIVFVATRGGFL